MFRFVRKLILVLLLAAAVGAGVALYCNDDPFYLVSDWLSLGRYQRYDGQIRDAAAKYGIDPWLIKAIAWRESEFRPGKQGTKGERGLMQVGEAAAADWVRAHKVQTFRPTDLFSPSMNLEIGTWYFKQALQRWAGKNDPIPFALAEYNAGKRHVTRWIDSTKLGASATADDLRTHIDYPKTRAYVNTILKRRAYYQTRAR